MAFFAMGAGMQWQPKRWVAVVLSLVSSMLALLYIGRWRWALAFAALSVAGFLASVLVPGLESLLIVVVALGYLLPVYLFFKVGGMAPQVRPWYSKPRGLVLLSVGVAGAILAVRTFAYEPFKMPSSAMEPTLPSGALLIVQKAGFGHFSTFGVTFGHGSSTVPARGEIIVFDFPGDRSITYVKRLVGLPGDVVRVEGSRIILNGKAIPVSAPDRDGVAREELLRGVPHTVRVDEGGFPYWQGQAFPGRELCVSSDVSIECRVPAGHYFVLGDNRPNSADSRIWGFVPADHVIGKVVSVVKPFEGSRG